MSQKSGTLDFCYFDIRKYSIFLISLDKTLSSEKNDTKIIWFGSVVLILQPFILTKVCSICARGWGGGVPRGGGEWITWPCLKPLGAQRIHPVTIYLTKNFHISTLYWYGRTLYSAVYHHTFIKICCVPHARSLVINIACHKHCGMGTRGWEAREATLW